LELIKKTIIIGLSVFVLSCEGNILSGFGTKTSDDAILVDIKNYQKLDQFDLALSKFDDLTPTKLAEKGTQVFKAQVYADACGLDFIVALASLVDGLGAGKKLFVILLESMTGANLIKTEYCVSAESIMLTQHAAGNLNVGDYTFLTVLSMAKMGSVLAMYQDKDSNDIVDVAADPCAVEASTDPNLSSGGLPSLYGKHLATGLSVMQLAVVSAVSGGFSSFTDLSTTLTSFCSVLSTLGPTYDFCGITDTSSITAVHEKSMRSMINESTAFGLSTCTGDITVCACL